MPAAVDARRALAELDDPHLSIFRKCELLGLNRNTLRKKNRDKVQSGGDAQFPAEFRELIKQYNVNIKNAKPTTTTPGGK